MVDLPEPGHAGKQHHPLLEVTQLLDGIWQAELLERWDVLGDEPGDHGEPPALLEDIHAVSRLVLADDVGEVGPARLFQDLTSLSRMIGEDHLLQCAPARLSEYSSSE